MNNFTLVNCDTDSISFTKPDGSPFTEVEQVTLLEDLNSLYPPKIRWEHDGVYEKVVILKAKNYILQKDGKVSKKGSSLKSSKIEPRLKDFMSEIIQCLLTDAKDSIIDVYHKYIREVHSLKSIDGYLSKKTVTEAVLNPERTTEQKILDALGGRPSQMGDKIYVYFAEERTIVQQPRHKKNKLTGEKEVVGYVEKVQITNPLRMREDWDASAPDHSVSTLLEKLYHTLIIFENVIDIKQFPKYHLTTKKKELEELMNGKV